MGVRRRGGKLSDRKVLHLSEVKVDVMLSLGFVSLLKVQNRVWERNVLQNFFLVLASFFSPPKQLCYLHLTQKRVNYLKASF